MDYYKVITLCGSTRFKKEFEKINKKLTLEGNVVISVACFGHAGDDIDQNQKELLDNIHLQKIRMADEIFVINKDGYIGASTTREIKYAQSIGKPIVYMEDPNGQIED